MRFDRPRQSTAARFNGISSEFGGFYCRFFVRNAIGFGATRDDLMLRQSRLVTRENRIAPTLPDGIRPPKLSRCIRRAAPLSLNPSHNMTVERTASFFSTEPRR
jgi:hypothetical protein